MSRVCQRRDERTYSLVLRRLESTAVGAAPLWQSGLCLSLLPLPPGTFFVPQCTPLAPLGRFQCTAAFFVLIEGRMPHCMHERTREAGNCARYTRAKGVLGLVVGVTQTHAHSILVSRNLISLKFNIVLYTPLCPPNVSIIHLHNDNACHRTLR